MLLSAERRVDREGRRRAAGGGGDRAGGAGAAEREDERDARATGCEQACRALARGQGREDPRLRRPPHLGLRRAGHDAQGAGRRRGAAAGRLRGPRRLRHLGDDGAGARRSSACATRSSSPRASTCRGRCSSPTQPGSTRPASPPTCTAGASRAGRATVREVLSRVKAIADVTLDTAGDGRPVDPDRDRRRPRKLGPARRRPARRRPARPTAESRRPLIAQSAPGLRLGLRRV